TLGIFDIPNYYIAGAFVPGREYMSPRGFSGSRYGDQAFMGTLELRVPMIPVNIVEIIKIIQIGNPTVALISDFGNAWNDADELQDMILTTGAEFRFALSLARSPLFIFSFGWAQSPEKWGYDWDKYLKLNEGDIVDFGPKPYFKMTLINPF
ncbi:MAG: hypothetical protein HOI40_01300, partial [Candidatus Marinimicrobia bacterium]|nr:hypothetical protein [Candidatus Neomarinimicrobiota bacterium]